jgi:hypothetical protein
MNTRIKTLLALVAFLATLAVARAQINRVDEDVWSGRKFANSTGDSLVGYPIKLHSTSLPRLEAAWPDSIVVSYYIQDTTRIRLSFKARRASAPFAKTVLDSLSTVTYSVGRTTISGALYASCDEMGLVVDAYSAGNTVRASGGNRVFIRFERYFTGPGR